MDEQKVVAFLVVCWNNKDLIDECLQAIQQQTYPHVEIYFIDNDSHDGSADYVKENYPEVHLTVAKQNYGFAKGNNILVKKALENPKVSYMALVNTDAVVPPHWCKTLVDFAVTKPKIAALQGLTVDYYNHKNVDSHHIYLRQDLQAVQYGYGEPNRHDFYHTTKVFGVNAAAAMYSRAFIESQPRKQLLDERFFMYLEDVDVSFRALMGGWENYFVQGAEAYHMGSVSAKKRSSDYSLYMSFRNQTALLYKNMPFKVFLKCLPYALRFERAFYLHTLRNSGLKTLLKVIRGRFVGICRIPLYLRDRHSMKHNKRIDDNFLLSFIRHHGQLN